MGNTKGILEVFAIAALLLALPSFAAQIIPEKNNPVCQEFSLKRRLRIYKDQNIVLSGLKGMEREDQIEEVMNEGPVLTELERGAAQLMLLGFAREEKNSYLRFLDSHFRQREEPQGSVAGEIYRNSSTIRIIPVKLCGEESNPYRDSVGFILEEDLRLAQVQELDDSLPPSVYPNPIPKLIRK